MVTDIIITTRNRPHYLRQTLTCLFQRTRTPYALHIIDDASTDGETVDWLLDLWQAGRIESLVLRNERAGIMANKNLSTWLAYSMPHPDPRLDIFVIAPDDVLVPDLEPDWLEQGLKAMHDRPKLGQLDLNHPGAQRDDEGVCDGTVVYCRCLGGTFGFIRRAALAGWNLPHYRENFGYLDEVLRSKHIREAGYQLGYLKDVFCYHIGKRSVAMGADYVGPMIPVKSWKTLEPDYA